MPFIEPPPKLDLERLYLLELQSVSAIAKKYGISNLVVSNWLDNYSIVRRTKNEQLAITGKRLTEHNTKRIAEIVAQSNEKVSAIVLAEQTNEAKQESDISCLPDIVDDDEVDDSPWSRLSRNKKEAVVMMASLTDKLNDMQIAEKIGVTPQTVQQWKKEPDFSYCLIAMRKEEMQRELTMLWSDDMYARYSTGKDLTRDDRKLVADVLGLIDDKQNINVSINVNDPYKRW